MKIRLWEAPQEVLVQDGAVTGIRLAATAQVDGQLKPTGESAVLVADMVLKAIGQSYIADAAGANIALKGGRIATDDDGQTSVERVWAGGDCRYGGRDLTVEAVEHGKRAAHAMHRMLMREVGVGA